jgi:hypothetical protein
MKEAMWRVDPDGEFKFSDATNPNQMVLFEADTTSTLVDQLQQQFCGKGDVPCLDVRRFIEDKTPFLKKHMTVALKQEEARGGVAVEPLKTDGKKRRGNTYPDNARLRFGAQ